MKSSILNPFKIKMKRTFFSKSKTSYSESKRLNYSSKDMYELVSNIKEYESFLPHVLQSEITSSVVLKNQLEMMAELTIGFDSFKERYESHVICIPHHKIIASSKNATLFHSLYSTWEFHPIQNNPNACLIDFKVEFEFKNPLYGHVSGLFFPQITLKIMQAFEKRAFDLSKKSKS